MARILVVDDEASVGYSFRRLLADDGHAVAVAPTGAEAMSMLEAEPFDLAILDVRLPDGSGLELLRWIMARDARAMVLIITAFSTTETAIEAIRQGAYDYILKPFDTTRIRAVIAEALETGRRMRTEVRFEGGDTAVAADRIVGSSEVMHEVYKMIGRVAASGVNVLIRGESGTGKELVARSIYQNSSRAGNRFIAVNSAAIPENLLESELFGYEKGAFTGATRRRIGKFELADGGVLFLDEIGDMAVSTQSKLLRVLQEGTFERLGGEETVRVDVRVVAATNKNLEALIEAGEFREDLYYRIKVITITMPPLRLRTGDIPELCAWLIEKSRRESGWGAITITPEAMDLLRAYPWPGNVRELENVLKRAIVLARGGVITPGLLAESLRVPAPAAGETRAEWLRPLPDSVLGAHDGHLHEWVMAEVEKNLIVQVLTKTGGNQVRAARILGISRMMLRERIDRYGIAVETTVSRRSDRD